MGRSKKMKDPVRGSAKVVEAFAPGMEGGKGRLQLNVTSDGVPPTAVEFSEWGQKHLNRWPGVGASIPVTVDRANPQNISIEWLEMPTRAEKAEASAQRAEASAEWGEAQDQRTEKLERNVQRRKELHKQHASGALTDSDYKQQMQELLAEAQQLGDSPGMPERP